MSFVEPTSRSCRSWEPPDQYAEVRTIGIGALRHRASASLVDKSMPHDPVDEQALRELEVRLRALPEMAGWKVIAYYNSGRPWVDYSHPEWSRGVDSVGGADVAELERYFMKEVVQSSEVEFLNRVPDLPNPRLMKAVRYYASAGRWSFRNYWLVVEMLADAGLINDDEEAWLMEAGPSGHAGWKGGWVGERGELAAYVEWKRRRDAQREDE